MTEHRRPSHIHGGGRRALRCTPVHRQLLKLVRDGRIKWCSHVGPSGGFTPTGHGTRFPPGSELVALYELRNAGLIGVEAEAGRVFITRLGLAHLLQGSACQPHPARLA